jgi:hypothetical protein
MLPYSVLYDTVYTDPHTTGTRSSQVIVCWGERCRIAVPAIKLMLQRKAPWIEFEVDTLPAPTPIEARPELGYQTDAGRGGDAQAGDTAAGRRGPGRRARRPEAIARRVLDARVLRRAARRRGG